jgi:hypothetical protein
LCTKKRHFWGLQKLLRACMWCEEAKTRVKVKRHMSLKNQGCERCQRNIEIKHHWDMSIVLNYSKMKIYWLYKRAKPPLYQLIFTWFLRLLQVSVCVCALSLTEYIVIYYKALIFIYNNLVSLSIRIMLHFSFHFMYSCMSMSWEKCALVCMNVEKEKSIINVCQEFS